jgi:hypothetical protein
MPFDNLDNVLIGSVDEFRRVVGLGEDSEPQISARDDRILRTMQPPESEETKDKVVSLVTTSKSDEQRAAEHKAALRVHAEKVCEVVTAAKRDGIMIGWEMGWDPAGRAFVQAINTMKPL